MTQRAQRRTSAKMRSSAKRWLVTYQRDMRQTLTPKFLRLVTAITIENLGQAMILVALPLLVIERYGLGAELTYALALRILPTLFGGVVAAWVLARLDARWVAAVGMVTTGLITLLIPFSRSVTELNITSIAAGVAGLFAGPALMALRSSVLDEAAAMRGNGLIVAAERAPFVIGPAIAAGAMLVTEVSAIFIVAAVTTTLAAALLIRMPAISRAKGERAPGSRVQLARWKRVILQDPRMHGYVVTGLAYTVAVSAGRLLFAALATLTFAEFPTALALLTGAMALGAVVGGFVASQFSHRAVGRVYVAGNLFEAVCLVGVGLSGSLPLALALLFLCGVFESIATAAFFADVQVRLPQDMTGTYFSLFGSAINACAVLGTLVGGWLVVNAEPPVVALVVAALIAIPLLPYIRAYLARPTEGDRVPRTEE